MSNKEINLKVGDMAPDFVSKDQNGESIKLSDFKGKKICLYFYPKDNTPGCTAEACNLRDNYSDLQEKGWVVLGVSADSVKSHKSFETKFNLPFPLIADEDKSIVSSYGVWQEKGFLGKKYMGIVRTTFLINEKGEIAKIIAKPNTANHAKEITL